MSKCSRLQTLNMMHWSPTPTLSVCWWTVVHQGITWTAISSWIWHILDNYTVIDNPVKMVGAGGHEFHGVGEGIIIVLAPYVNGTDRRVRFKCTTVLGLERHLFSIGAAQRKGADTINQIIHASNYCPLWTSLGSNWS